MKSALRIMWNYVTRKDVNCGTFAVELSTNVEHVTKYYSYTYSLN